MVVLAACGGQDSAEGPSGAGNGTGAAAPDDEPGEHAHDGPAGACEPSGASLSIAANNLKFDKDCLAAPAGQAFTIAFNNGEALPHNVAILREHGSSDALFRGELFTGPGTRDYRVDALNAGNYHFHCDVHPDMQGDFIVK